MMSHSAFSSSKSTRGLSAFAWGGVIFASVALLAAHPALAAEEDIAVTAYSTDDCSGGPVFYQTFYGGSGTCQSLTLPGTDIQVYGYVWCEDGVPNFEYCGSSPDCSGTCETMSLVGDGECGSSWGVFSGGAIAQCLSDDISVTAYSTDECSGSPVFSQTFTGGSDTCQSLTLPGTDIQVYGYAWCEDGVPNFEYCGTSPDCDGTCETMSLVGAGECGSSWGVFSGGAVAQCSGSTALSQATTSNAAKITGSTLGALAAACVMAIAQL